ncbi:hypothetical protein [Planobispora longispora]|uniref:Uncharacterized protein n=1 Tax=Planobispora longispora TaxID=28887 RepID=A0A8J3RRK0_9ACTN|nr:hypothetical protein [Planobispora longispora]GIH79950.1 hypothetical protein Plo01_63790 [Planobispora longispora]
MSYDNETTETRERDWRPYMTAGAALAAAAVVAAAFAADSGRHGSATAPPGITGLQDRPGVLAAAPPALPLLPELSSAAPPATAASASPAEPPPGPQTRRSPGRSGPSSGRGTGARVPAVQGGEPQGIGWRPEQTGGGQDRQGARADRPGRSRAAARAEHRSPRPAEDGARSGETGRRPSARTDVPVRGTPRPTGRPTRPGRSTSCARIPLTGWRSPHCTGLWGVSEGRGIIETILGFVAPRQSTRQGAARPPSSG